MLEKTLPIWVQYIQALGPTFITIVAALIASTIAWRQWKTAHQKVVLDLFERRMATYREIRSSIGDMVVTGNCTNQVLFEFLSAIEPVRFIFGPEVQAYVVGLHKDVVAFQEHCKMREHATGSDLEKALESRARRFDRLKAVYDEFPSIIAPYVEMHQKLP